MARKSRKNQKSQSNVEGYVVVAFAEDFDQAMEYKTLLDSNDVPSIVSEQNANDESSDEAQEIAIMVPEEYLDEAHVIIESQQSYDDFCDFAMGDESDSDLDEDLFDDEF
jgi:hypothetical protein